MIAHAGIIDQEIDRQIAFVQPIAEPFQVNVVAEVQGSLEELKMRIDCHEFGRERLQAINATSYQDDFARDRRQLTCKLPADPRRCSGNDDRGSCKRRDTHTLHYAASPSQSIKVTSCASPSLHRSQIFRDLRAMQALTEELFGFAEQFLCFFKREFGTACLDSSA